MMQRMCRQHVNLKLSILYYPLALCNSRVKQAKCFSLALMLNLNLNIVLLCLNVTVLNFIYIYINRYLKLNYQVILLLFNIV